MQRKHKGKNEGHKRDVKLDFSIAIQARFTAQTKRSPPSLPHFVIETPNFRFWLTNPRLKTEIESLEKWQGAPTPLGSIYRPNQKTKVPLGPSTMKTVKLG
jgi:hypothetical protein